MSEWTGFMLYKGTWRYRARQPSSLTAIACIANLQKVSIGLMPVNPDTLDSPILAWAFPLSVGRKSGRYA
jgi:hypothetical protein